MIYPLLVLLITFLEILKFQKADPRLDRTYSNILWWVLILMAAFRGSVVGADTAGYIEDYEMMPLLSFYQVSVLKVGYLGYFYPCKFFSLLGVPLPIWFGFVEGIYIYSMYKFVKKYSVDNIYSILIFVTNGLFTFSMAGQKQVMSMSLFLLAFLYFTEKKYIKMVLAALWGGACHSAGMIFLFAFGMYIFRNNRFFIFVITGIAIAIYSLSKVFTTQIVMILVASKEGGEHFEGYLDLDTSYTPVTLIFYMGSVLTALFFIVGYWNKFKGEAAFVYGMCIFACSMQTLAGINPTLFRLALPYTPFMMILLPNTASTIGNKQKRLLYNYAVWGWHISYFLLTIQVPFEFM